MSLKLGAAIECGLDQTPARLPMAGKYNEANGTIFAVGYDELTHTYTPPGGGGGDGGGGGP